MSDSTRHGHRNGYYVDKCRCDACKAAAAEYTREMRVKRKGSTPPEAHGTRHGYANFGCRCEPCKAANAAYLADFRKRPGKKQIADDASRRWAEANPDRLRKRRREYMRIYAHIKKMRLLAQDRRDVSVRDWLRLCARYHNRCAYCGEAKPLTMDHIIPVIRGGRHSIGNLIPACRNCNAQKRTRLIVEWRAGRKAAA